MLLLTGNIDLDCHNRRPALLRLAKVYAPVELVRLVECFYRCYERDRMDELRDLEWYGKEIN